MAGRQARSSPGASAGRRSQAVTDDSTNTWPWYIPSAAEHNVAREQEGYPFRKKVDS